MKTPPELNDIVVNEPDASTTSRFGKPSTTPNNKRKVYHAANSDLVLEEDQKDYSPARRTTSIDSETRQEQALLP